MNISMLIPAWCKTQWPPWARMGAAGVEKESFWCPQEAPLLACPGRPSVGKRTNQHQTSAAFKPYGARGGGALGSLFAPLHILRRPSGSPGEKGRRTGQNSSGSRTMRERTLESGDFGAKSAGLHNTESEDLGTCTKQGRHSCARPGRSKSLMRGALPSSPAHFHRGVETVPLPVYPYCTKMEETGRVTGGTPDW